MTKIYIVDTETTGLVGAPRDLVVDIGICEFDTFTQNVKDVYSSRLGYDTSEWSDSMKNAWIFTHQGADLTVEDVTIPNAPPAEQVIQEVKTILDGQLVTSYNMPFDFDKFLLKGPWWLNVHLGRDIMLSATAYILNGTGDGRYQSLQKAYDFIFRGYDPAKIGSIEKHLGLPDARMAAYVLKKLWQMNMYRI